jgi:acyl-coenzyme A synthetase/AMP-(fatty) acid ligase
VASDSAASVTLSDETISGDWNLAGLFVREGDECVAIADLAAKSALYDRADELRGRSVLLATKRQLTTASALIELDGLARRVVLCPSDLPLEYLPHVIDVAEVDSIVSGREVMYFCGTRRLYFSAFSNTLVPASRNGHPHHETEWVLLTSGTTGAPKLVAHTLASLSAGIRRGRSSSRPVIWSTFYDIRRYGGLQILIRALLTGASLVLSEEGEATTDFLARAGSMGVTHISGTPSHWRRALMSEAIHRLKPEYVRLSGEAPDETVLRSLREIFPEARIVHAFASTEAGLAFEVGDGAAGFPPEAMTSIPGVEISICEDTLRIRSAGNASRYLGEHAPQLKEANGWVNTGDLVEMREGRYFFRGRRDGVINVGGLKVHPEEVEAAISRHPEVQMCVVRAKKSRITGALVTADVVLRDRNPGEQRDIPAIQDDILQLCREGLPAHKVPAGINIVAALELSQSGKVLRRNA